HPASVRQYVHRERRRARQNSGRDRGATRQAGGAPWSHRDVRDPGAVHVVVVVWDCWGGGDLVIQSAGPAITDEMGPAAAGVMGRPAEVGLEYRFLFLAQGLWHRRHLLDLDFVCPSQFVDVVD